MIISAASDYRAAAQRILPPFLFHYMAFFTGREPQRDKPTRYSALVEASTAYSQPSVTGTEKLSEA